MFKKFPLMFLLAIVVTLSVGYKGFGQVKKPSTQKTTTVKKTTSVHKARPVAKTVEITPTAPAVDSSIRIKITTDSGIMIIKLYDSTPLHRDNFVKLVKEDFYDSLLFHRVIPGFMIQGGDPESKNAPAGSMLGNGGGNMPRIPAEFRPNLIHKKGVLAAARDGNPEKASSPCQFYIVEGKILSDPELNMIEGRKGKKYSISERNIYKTMGGTPMLDQDYTVFGEIESGIEVISKIASAPRDNNNRPVGDIRMNVELIK